MTNSKITALVKPDLEIDTEPHTISETNQKYQLKSLHVTWERPTDALSSRRLQESLRKRDHQSDERNSLPL